MGIGFGVVLIIVGAILAFAVSASVTGINLVLIGWILIGGGALVVLLTLTVFMPRSRRARSTAITTDSLGRQTITERDDRISGA